MLFFIMSLRNFITVVDSGSPSAAILPWSISGASPLRSNLIKLHFQLIVDCFLLSNMFERNFMYPSFVSSPANMSNLFSISSNSSLDTELSEINFLAYSAISSLASFFNSSVISVSFSNFSRSALSIALTVHSLAILTLPSNSLIRSSDGMSANLSPYSWRIASNCSCIVFLSSSICSALFCCNSWNAPESSGDFPFLFERATASITITIMSNAIMPMPIIAPISAWKKIEESKIHEWNFHLFN